MHSLLSSYRPMLLALLASAVCWAQASERAPVVKAARDEAVELRLHAGVSVHSGAQQSPRLDLAYSGWTPSDLAATAWVWLLLDQHLGVVAGIGREGVGLYAGDGTLTAKGGLLRFQIAPSYRLRLGPVRLEPQVGYALHQLPSFSLDPELLLQPVARHALNLGLRASVDVGPVTFEARGELPVVSAGRLAGMKSSGFTAGGALRVSIVQWGHLRVGGVAEVSLAKDSLLSEVLGSSNQSLVRAGVALAVLWQDPPSPSTPAGTVRLAVVDAASKLPLPAAFLEAQASGRDWPLRLDASGSAYAEQVPPGSFVVKATLEGYEPAEARADIVAGSSVTVTLALAREAPKVGAVAFSVTDKLTGAPVAQAEVRVAGDTRTTDAQGRLLLEKLPPGPLALTVLAPGYLQASETAMVVAGVNSPAAIQLLPEKKRVPATVEGRVRSAKGGGPISAELTIPEARIKERARRDGAFSFSLPAGSYTVFISAPGFVSQRKSVSVKDAEQAIFNVDLVPQ